MDFITPSSARVNKLDEERDNRWNKNVEQLYCQFFEAVCLVRLHDLTSRNWRWTFFLLQ